MSTGAVVLSEPERTIVARIFGQVIRERQHRVFAATIQAAHVHILFAPLREDLTRVVARLKRRSAAAVLARRRQSSRQPVGRSLWTAGKFPVFVFDERHLCNAIEYVRDHNRRAALPPDPFDWIAPLYPPGANAGERFCGRSESEQPRLQNTPRQDGGAM